MKVFKIKFFGSKDHKEQIKLLRMNVQAESKERVREVLRYKYGFVVINGLKIHEID